MGTPSLRQLDIFAQMVASGSIVRCARDLGLSVEAVERDMDALEERLGYRLFERATDEAHLTEAGRKTVRAMTLLSENGLSAEVESAPEAEILPPDEEPQQPIVPTIIDVLDAEPVRVSLGAMVDMAPMEDFAREPVDARVNDARLDDALADVSAGDADDDLTDGRQQVTIAAPAAVFSHFQDALTAFEQSSNDVVIALDLGVQIAPDAARAMALGSADITYFYALGAPDSFASRYVWSEQLIVYLGADHPLTAADMVSLRDLQALAPVAMDAQSGVRAIVEQALAKAGLPPRLPVLESDNLFDIMTAVRDGAGYFAAFGAMARDFGRMPGIRRLPVADPLPVVEVRQAVRGAVADDPIVSSLAEYLFR